MRLTNASASLPLMKKLSRSFLIPGALALTLASGCEFTVNAIDLKAPVTSKSTTPSEANGNKSCPQETITDTANTNNNDIIEALFAASADGQKFREAAKGAVGEVCIQSIESGKLELQIGSLVGNPDQCPAVAAGEGSITFKEIVLSNEKGNPATLRLSCNNAVGEIAVAGSVQQAINQCALDNFDKVKEYFRGAFNQKVNAITVVGGVECASGTCYTLSGEVKARFSKVLVHMMKGCTAYTAPTN